MDGDGDQVRKMGTTGTINLRPGEGGLVDLTGQVHQLPCCIKYNGSSSITHYFKPKPAGMEVDGLSVQEAYFRGRKLQGASIPIPEGYCGFVLGKKNPDKKKKVPNTCDGGSNYWEANAKFKNLTFWNHDDLPSENDAFLRCFQWFTVANALHKPVTADDLNLQNR